MMARSGPSRANRRGLRFLVIRPGKVSIHVSRSNADHSSFAISPFRMPVHRPPGLERRTFSSGPWAALEDTPETHHDATRRLSWAAPATAGPIRADEGQKSRLVAFGGCRAPHRDRFRFPKRSEHEAGRP